MCGRYWLFSGKIYFSLHLFPHCSVTPPTAAESKIICHPDDGFFREWLASISKDIPNILQQDGFVVKKKRKEDWCPTGWKLAERWSGIILWETFWLHDVDQLYLYQPRKWKHFCFRSFGTWFHCVVKRSSHEAKSCSCLKYLERILRLYKNVVAFNI